ncbi:MAG TPA: hypothetical protein VGK55_00065 [Actinomycetes bacterium]|jgi:hypothetical protein
MRRFFLVSLGLLAAMVVGSATPALADSGVIKGVFIEDSKASCRWMTRPPPHASAINGKATARTNRRVIPAMWEIAQFLPVLYRIGQQ